MTQPLSTRYKVLQIFEGGSSLLQKAQDLRTNQTVVLKFPSNPEFPEARERIAREARVFQHLAREGRIPGLVQFIGYEENQGDPLGPFLTLEFLRGTTIAERLETRGVLSEEDTISIGRSLCRTMNKLHARGVIHRDVSINNIFLLEGSGDVRLIDLGLALVQRPDGEFEPHDKGKVGTPATRAPELSDSFPGDERSDIFSMGKVLYQLANGQETSGQELHGLAPKAKSRVQEDLSEIIVRCVQKAPDARYRTVQELDRALRALQIKKAAKKIAVRLSPFVGTLLLAGVVYSFNQTTKKTPFVAPQSTPATLPTMVLETPSATQPTTTPHAAIATEEKNTAPTKTPKKTAEKKPVKEEEEFELSQELIDYATQPIPIAKPRPIEIRNGTKNK